MLQEDGIACPSLAKDMNTIAWDNLIIERRESVSWLARRFKESIFYAFWRVFSAPST
jgi:hypothetical protein